VRICYFADGRYVHTHRWMRYFHEKGHAVHLISFAPLDPQHIRAVEAAGGTYHGEIVGFHLKRFWVTGGELLRLRRILSRERIDLLHCQFLGANAWYGAVSGFHPLIVTVMGGDICGRGWRPGEDPRERWLTPLAMRRADLITCWSVRLTETVRDYAPPETPVEVIHGGVDLTRFLPGERPSYLLARWNLPEDAQVILSSRLMRPLYNLDQIAKAAVDLCRMRPRVHMLFAYLNEAKDEASEARVHAIVRESDVAGRIHFIGPIPHLEMADHYRLADVTVSIPSTDGTPMTVLESMACGTPVVVSDIADYDPQYIEAERTVLAVPPDDPAAIRDAILRLVDDPALAARLAAEAGRRVRTDGSYEAQMSRMEALYQRLLDGA
jgi:glycosyltransferase involved in cell wall biosynthesis